MDVDRRHHVAIDRRRTPGTLDRATPRAGCPPRQPTAGSEARIIRTPTLAINCKGPGEGKHGGVDNVSARPFDPPEIPVETKRRGESPRRFDVVPKAVRNGVPSQFPRFSPLKIESNRSFALAFTLSTPADALRSVSARGSFELLKSSRYLFAAVRRSS